jgi:hypothetical protein
MLQGVINNNNIEEIFRGISLKRKQGDFEIDFGESKYRIFFINGKVVDIEKIGSSTVEEIVNLYCNAGVLTEVVCQEIVSVENISLKELYNRLTAFGITQEGFKFVVKHNILQKFFQIDLQLNGIYSFTMGTPLVDKEYMPSIATGQLLLELVSFRSLMETFHQTFPKNALVVKAANKDSLTVSNHIANLNERSRIVYSLIEERSDFYALKAKSFLCDYYYFDALITLEKLYLIKLIESGSEVYSEDACHNNTVSESHTIEGKKPSDVFYNEPEEGIKDSLEREENEAHFDKSIYETDQSIQQINSEREPFVEKPSLGDEEVVYVSREISNDTLSEALQKDDEEKKILKTEFLYTPSQSKLLTYYLNTLLFVYLTALLILPIYLW